MISSGGCSCSLMPLLHIAVHLCLVCFVPCVVIDISFGERNCHGMVDNTEVSDVTCDWFIAYFGRLGNRLDPPKEAKCLHNSFNYAGSSWGLEIACTFGHSEHTGFYKKSTDHDSQIFTWEEEVEFPNELEMEGGNFRQRHWLVISERWRIRRHWGFALLSQTSAACPCCWAWQELLSQTRAAPATAAPKKSVLLYTLLSIGWETWRRKRKSPHGRWSIFNEPKPLPQIKWNILKGNNITLVLFVSAT